jgi:hypothetical protein
VLADRYDAKGELWRVQYNLPMLLPDVPAVIDLPWGLNDLQANVLVSIDNFNNSDEQYKIVDPPKPNQNYTPAALQGESVR